MYTGQTEIDYVANTGRKAVKGRVEGNLYLITTKEKRENQKLCYVYRNGMTQLNYPDWTDKPV